MRTTKSRSLIAAAALAATGAIVTWSIASEVVILHPAILRAQFNYTSEQVTQIQLLASPSGGQTSSRVVSSPTNPFSVDLIVEGGDGAAGLSNPGVSYNTRMYVYLAGQPNTYMYVQRAALVPVQNLSEEQPDEEIFAMPLVSTNRVTANVQVLGGGKITQLQIYTSVSDPAGNYFQGVGYNSFSAKPTSASIWIPSFPHASVQIAGTAWVEDVTGTVSQRSLSSQIINATSPVTAPTWTIDLGNATAVRGVFGAQLPTASRGRYCYYEGRGAASGIYGNTHVPSPGTECLVSLSPPATYAMYVQSLLPGPGHQNVETPFHTLNVTGGTHTETFNEVHSSAILRPELDGMIDPERVSVSWNSYMQLVANNSTDSNVSAAVNGYLTHVLPVGAWKTWMVRAYVSDLSDPLIPLSSSIDVYNYNDPEFAQANVIQGVTTDLGVFYRKLGRTNVFFDVKDPENGPQTEVTYPSVRIEKYDRAPNNSVIRRTYINAYGSGAPSHVSALSVMAPPGEYTLLARATVNGSQVTFANSIIRFGNVIDAGPGDAGTPINLTPDDPDLELTLKFPEIDQLGHSSVVETPIGPEPPEKFKLSCEEAVGPGESEIGCTQLYYDISTTVQHRGGIEVCVKKRIVGSMNALADSLYLFHYDADETVCDLEMDTDPTTPGCWENITTSVLDCSDPAHSVACGCADEACGSDPGAEQPINVFKVCGTTDDFSPFAVMEISRHRFNNVVDGVEYTGPNGPPALQQFEVPRTGKYRITATGARGGHATKNNAITGGCGAEVSGTFQLEAGDVLEMLVGQAGSSSTDNGGGGGGTFVTKRTSPTSVVPLLVAGGGGGVRAAATVIGRHGGLTTDGVPGSTSSNYSLLNVAGGVNGTGGARAAGLGSGGGGWSGNGGDDGTYGQGGRSFLNSGAGGLALPIGAAPRCPVTAPGGYGGGGSGNGCYGGGGGGGYSGGGAGRVAGGGGSYNGGFNPAAAASPTTCTLSGHGGVLIERIN